MTRRDHSRAHRPQRPKTSHHHPERVRGHDQPDSFRCLHCRLDVAMRAPGTVHRNHCPNCLHSLHVDDRLPGDRAADCGARMEPIAIAVRGDGEWVLVHRCLGCDELSTNRTAADDSPLLLVRLATRPLALPPFPLEHLARL